jgi:hypothetical protein
MPIGCDPCTQQTKDAQQWSPLFLSAIKFASCILVTGGLFSAVSEVVSSEQELLFGRPRGTAAFGPFDGPREAIPPRHLRLAELPLNKIPDLQL